MDSTLAKIKSLKTELTQAAKRGETEKALQAIASLRAIDISRQLIQDTKIGKSVGKLRKSENAKIAAECTKLVNEWKSKIAASPPQNNTTPQNTPPSTTDAKSNSNNKEASSTSTGTTKATGNGNSSATRKEDSPKRKRSEEEEEEEEETQNTKKAKRPEPKEFTDEKYAKSVSMIQQALSVDGDNGADTLLIAKQIEEELRKSFQGRDYTTKCRSIVFNLKNAKNPELRKSVLSGAITPEKLCKMTHQEMAPDDLRRERARMAEYSLEASKITPVNQTSTDMFKCGKCGKRQTTYHQLQTRSADEPMTTFHQCMVCGNRWKS